MITGIHKRYEKHDFIKEFITENVEITQGFGPSIADMLLRESVSVSGRT